MPRFTAVPSLPAVASFFLTAALLACGSSSKSGPAQAAPAQAATDGAAGTASSEATSGPAAGVVGSVSVTPFGVPECDTYVKQFLSCVEGRVPEAQRDKFIEAFEANRQKWRALSTMREGALALGMACRAAAQKSKEELQVDYGCEF